MPNTSEFPSLGSSNSIPLMTKAEMKEMAEEGRGNVIEWTDQDFAPDFSDKNIELDTGSKLSEEDNHSDYVPKNPLEIKSGLSLDTKEDPRANKDPMKLLQAVEKFMMSQNYSKVFNELMGFTIPTNIIRSTLGIVFAELKKMTNDLQYNSALPSELSEFTINVQLEGKFVNIGNIMLGLLCAASGDDYSSYLPTNA